MRFSPENRYILITAIDPPALRAGRSIFGIIIYKDNLIRVSLPNLYQFIIRHSHWIARLYIKCLPEFRSVA